MLRVDSRAVRRFLVGDALAILAFVVVGQVQHGFPPLDYPARFAGTAGPFLAGWLVAAPVVRAYSAGVLTSVRAAAGRALLAWVAADVVAQLLRDTAAFPGSADPVFFAVASVFGGGLLVLWRSAAVLVGRRRSADGSVSL